MTHIMHWCCKLELLIRLRTAKNHWIIFKNNLKMLYSLVNKSSMSILGGESFKYSYFRKSSRYFSKVYTYRYLQVQHSMHAFIKVILWFDFALLWLSRHLGICFFYMYIIILCRLKTSQIDNDAPSKPNKNVPVWLFM